jgi:hypothetical protein
MGAKNNAGSVWRIDCGKFPDPFICANQKVGGMSFWAWDGHRWVKYAGHPSRSYLEHWVDLTLGELVEAEGSTELFVASLVGDLDHVKSLLAKGLDVDDLAQATVDGRTALYAAASNGNVEVVRVLLKAGASVEWDRWDPLLVASKEGHIAGAWQLLEEAGASVQLDEQDCAILEEDATDGSKSPDADASRPDDVDDPIMVTRPKIIHLTYSSRADVEPKVWEQFRRFASDHEVRFYDDSECLVYLQQHFEHLVEKYLELEMPTHRADLFRYAVMYREGGIYLDIKTVLARSVSDAFPDQERLYTVLSKNKGFIHQGILASPPRNPFFTKLINRILKTPRFEGQGTQMSKWDKTLYHSFTKQFYGALQGRKKKVSPSLSILWKNSPLNLPCTVMPPSPNTRKPQRTH